MSFLWGLFASNHPCIQASLFAGACLPGFFLLMLLYLAIGCSQSVHTLEHSNCLLFDFVRLETLLMSG